MFVRERRLFGWRRCVCVRSSHVSYRKRNASAVNLDDIPHAAESYSSIVNITQRLYTHQSHFLSQSSTLFLISFPRVLIFRPLQGSGLLPAGRVHAHRGWAEMITGKTLRDKQHTHSHK